MSPKILIPVNDSPTTQKTIEDVIKNRERFPQTLTLLHVINDQLAYRMIPDFQVEMVREMRKRRRVFVWKNLLLNCAGGQGLKLT